MTDVQRNSEMGKHLNYSTNHRQKATPTIGETYVLDRVVYVDTKGSEIVSRTTSHPLLTYLSPTDDGTSS